MADQPLNTNPARASNITFAPEVRQPQQSEVFQLQDAKNFGSPVHRVGTASSDIHRTRIGRLWTRWIRVTVPQKACRDHFALERTVLAYVRTSQAFAVLAVTIAQFMRLNTTGSPNLHFGYYKIAVPLSSCCLIIAITVVLAGTIRFFHWQATIARGNSLSSGWELLVPFFLTLGMLLTIFVLVLTLAIERSQ